jgi:hypothetical protein
MPVSVVPKRERVSVARPGVTRARLGRRGRRRRRLPAQTHSAPEGRPARADGRRDAVITLLKRPGAADTKCFSSFSISGVWRAWRRQAKSHDLVFDRTLAPAARTRAHTTASAERLARKRVSEARATHAADAPEVGALQSRGHSAPGSLHLREAEGGRSRTRRDKKHPSAVSIQSREPPNSVSPCRTSWRRSPRSSWR